MVYKGCDVGSAKPSKETLKHHPHHLIDCIEPTSVFTVSDFVNKSLELIDEIHAKNKIYSPSPSFNCVGPGAVGTGSLSGMRFLHILKENLSFNNGHFSTICGHFLATT